MSAITAHDPGLASSLRRLSIASAGEAAPTASTLRDVNSDDAAGHGRLSAIIAGLLDDADEALYRDRQATRACLERARALLRAGQEPTALERKSAPHDLVRGGLASWQTTRVAAHIEAHLDATIRMGDLTAIARLSPGHFSRSFKRSFGQTLSAYIAGRRLLRAQTMMLTTDEPLGQIAIACGLCDQSHLTRLFRRHLDVSPSVWRRRHRTEPARDMDAPSPESHGAG